MAAGAHRLTAAVAANAPVVVVAATGADHASDPAIGPAACCRNASQPIRAARPMLVSVANWLRWRRLAKASPGPVWLIQGLNSVAQPKYCT